LAIAPLSLLAPRQRIALAATGAGPVLVTLLALSITENSLRKPSIGLTVAVMTLAAVSVQANSPATRLASTMKPQTSRLADSFSA